MTSLPLPLRVPPSAEKFLHVDWIQYCHRPSTNFSSTLARPSFIMSVYAELPCSIEFKWWVMVRFSQNATENNDVLKKWFEPNVFWIKYSTKNSGMHVSIYLCSWVRGLHRLSFLEYFNALEYESRFTSGLNTTKNTRDVKKCFKQKLFRIKFSSKNSANAYLYLAQKWS